MAHHKLAALEEHGYVVLEPHDPVPEHEWKNLEFMDWKSGGDTRFAPIASAHGEMECAGFWDHGKADKDGIWTANAEVCPTLVGWATEEVGAGFGRHRVIELQPNTYDEAIGNLHQDDNNRLNPDGEGWVVRAWLQLSDNPESYMILRSDKDDPSTEVRIPCPAGAQFVVDSERLHHAVWHPGTEPRYSLIVSYESGDALERWIEDNRASQQPVPTG
jgi:hypothetical protein